MAENCGSSAAEPTRQTLLLIVEANELGDDINQGLWREIRQLVQENPWDNRVIVICEDDTIPAHYPELHFGYVLRNRLDWQAVDAVRASGRNRPSIAACLDGIMREFWHSGFHTETMRYTGSDSDVEAWVKESNRPQIPASSGNRWIGLANFFYPQ